MKHIRPFLFTLLLLLGLNAPRVRGQAMPQDNWYRSEYWDSSGSNTNLFNAPKGMSIGPDGLVYVCDDSTIKVVNQSGQYIRQWYSGSCLALSAGVSNRVAVIWGHANGNGMRVHDAVTGAVLAGGGDGVGTGSLFTDEQNYIYRYSNHTLWKYNKDLTLVKSWTADPNFPLETTQDAQTLSQGNDGNLWLRFRDFVRVFSRSGAFIRKFTLNNLPGYTGNDALVQAVGPDGLMYTSEVWNYGRYPQDPKVDRITVVDPQLGWLFLQPVLTPSESVNYGTINSSRMVGGLALDSLGRLLVSSTSTGCLMVYERARRTFHAPIPNRPPVPFVQSVAQRYGTTLFDIDYKVMDPDSATGMVAAVAFKDGVHSLEKLVRMETVVEGTSANLGSTVFTNQLRRLTWDAAADFSTNFTNLAVTLLAKDEAGLLGLEYVTLPAEGGSPTLKICRSPVTQSELMPLWYWLLARHQSGIILSNRMIYADSWNPEVWTPLQNLPGVRATYYDNSNFTGTQVEIIQPQVNDEFTNDASPTIANSDFSVRWQGRITAPVTGTFTIGGWSSGTFQLSLNGTLVATQNTVGQRLNVSHSFTAGVPVDFLFNATHSSGTLFMHLLWNGPSIADQLIPASAFSYALGDPLPKLAEGVTTTANGRKYLFERILNVREATAAEILRAKEAGHIGLINQFNPRNAVAGHPAKINEYGFDTATTWLPNAWFVVPVTP